MQRCALFFLPLVLLFCLPGSADADPKIVAEKRDFQFGSILQGEKIAHVFKFHNAGDAPLHIEKVRTSCGCTAAVLSAKAILPGETGELKSTFDSARFSGSIVKTVYLYSNDPRQSVVQFHLRGTVKEEIVPTPAQVDFGAVVPGGATEAKIVITNRGKHEITFPTVDVSIPELTAVLSAGQLPPGGDMELTVTVTPTAGKRKLNGYVILATSSPRVPELRIPVFASIPE